MPDAELFAAAVAGELATRAGVERQVRRMLDDPKARPAVVHFHNQWLGTDQVLRVAPARRAFGPLFGITPEIECPRARAHRVHGAGHAGPGSGDRAAPR